MYRFLFLIIQLALISLLLFNTAASGSEGESNLCRKCHEDVYVKAISYRYQHSVVRDKCILCHVRPEDNDNTIVQFNVPTLQSEWILYLDQLAEDREYKAELIVTDSNGKSYSPKLIDIAPKNLWKQSDQMSSLTLKKLSRVTVDEIEKRGFARATISWDTDVFATSEIEYRSRGERGSTFKANDLYTKDHRIILDGLKHKSRYYFRAVSRDIYGNTVKSEEYAFDTAEVFSHRTETGRDNAILPMVERLQVFRIQKNRGLYLKVSANKPSEISVRIKDIKKMGDNHGFGLLPARYSRIDICSKCHPYDSSHPVGVSAISSKSNMPDGLPTIEDGIITCVTCHQPHGGSRKYYSRFDFRKDLCMRCHLQKYSM